MFLSYTDAQDASENGDFLTDMAIFTKALRTDGPTDRPTDQRTNGRTYPLIEMRGCI